MIIPARLCVLVASAHSVYGNAGVCATGDDNYYQNNITVSIPSPFQKGRVAPWNFLNNFYSVLNSPMTDIFYLRIFKD